MPANKEGSFDLEKEIKRLEGEDLDVLSMQLVGCQRMQRMIANNSKDSYPLSYELASTKEFFTMYGIIDL